ncbi:hypothetical protein D3C75_888400 [compost metagenome]
MLAQEPAVGLVPGQTGAVNPRLLSGADADGLSIQSVHNGVGLGIFQRNQRNQQIPLGLLRQILVCGDDMAQRIIVDNRIIALLLQS